MTMRITNMKGLPPLFHCRGTKQPKCIYYVNFHSSKSDPEVANTDLPIFHSQPHLSKLN